MVRIRLRRIGRKKAPVYRIVVADSQSPRDGKFIEIIGQYAPRQSEGGLNVNEDRANYWMNVGAQPSDTVRSLLRRAGVLKRRHEARTGRLVTSPAGNASSSVSAPEEQPDMSNVIPIAEDRPAES
ncbi:MAG: 30S ribosomal protein S16 [Gemmatimonadaceae bacterium]